ncbi:MAG TPA: translocation/assembly module TamB domain-containing protein, partial [Candidatus Babeliales bacterium]|nr:translocation/assembly module TamB domain-containing protein [Candidatus Babeliales bacterium]
MLKKISIAIILGFFIMLFFAQYDPWTHRKIVQVMQKIAHETLGGELACTVQSVNFFSPSVILHDLEMKSLDHDSWWWRCKKCEIHCSWLHLLFKGCIEEYVIIDGFECYSRSNKAHFLIEPHIMAMMQKTLLPFEMELKSLIFKNAHFHTVDEQYNSKVELFFNSSSLRIGSFIKTTIAIERGGITYEHREYVRNIAADVVVNTLFDDTVWSMSGQGAGTCILPQMPEDEGECYFSGTWKGDRGRFSLRNAYNSFIVDPIIITERELRCNARFPLAYAADCIIDSPYKSIINGVGHCSLKVNRDAQTVDGQLVVEDVILHDHHVCDTGKIIFGKHDDDWKIRLALSRYNQECKGTGYWQQTLQKGEFMIKNSTELSAKNLSYWRIKPHHFLAQVSIDHAAITGSYDLTTSHALSDAMHTSNGLISYNQETLMGQGFINENQYTFAARIYPDYMLHHCIYKDKDDKQLITLHATDSSLPPTHSLASQFSGSIAFPFIRSLLNSTLKYDVQGEGNLDIAATILPTEVVADVVLKDSTIRLPQTYNFIDGFNAHCAYDFINRIATFEDINLSLHTGKVNCLRATAHFDQQGSLIFAHAPCIIDNCLLNIKKDLFATISGNILFSKKLSEDSSLQGNIIINKAQLKENLFSGIIQKQLLSYTHAAFSLPDIPLQYAISIETKYPIVVDTGFLQTNAHVNMKVYKDMHEPTMSGSIVLQSGTLNFPYKPLYISKGVITFSPERLFDPTLE